MTNPGWQRVFTKYSIESIQASIITTTVSLLILTVITIIGLLKFKQLRSILSKKYRKCRQLELLDWITRHRNGSLKMNSASGQLSWSGAASVKICRLWWGKMRKNKNVRRSWNVIFQISWWYEPGDGGGDGGSKSSSGIGKWKNLVAGAYTTWGVTQVSPWRLSKSYLA